MADNFPLTPGTGRNVATDQVTYSGDTADVQLVRFVQVTGAEGSRTVVNLPGDATDGLLVNLGANNDVTLGAALPAGTNAIGKLAANSGVDIGDVDVTSLVPGTGATSLGKAIDTALGATDTGVLALTVRDDTLTTLTEADGDVSALRVDSTGRLWCNVANTVTVSSHAVTNAGTFAVQVDGSALTALQLIDDPVFADDAAFTVGASKVTMAGAVAVAHGSNPDAADANDAVALITNRHRIPFVVGGHPNVVTIKHTTITTAVTDAAIVSVNSGTKIVVTRVTATLDNASTVFPTLLLGFGATNTPTTTGVIVAHGGVPAGGGVNVGDGSGILGIGGDGEDLRTTTTGNATGNGLQICVSYYTIES